MAKKLVFLCVAIGLLLALSSCWLMDQKVARTVKKSMQQSMDSDPQYAGKGLKVLEVKVNKLDKDYYDGIATVEYQGETHPVKIKISIDRSIYTWEPEEGEFSFIE